MTGENETKIQAEVEAAETTAENKEGKTAQEEFISEFAPEPIKIPKYNKEKEMRKVEKANEKNRKRKTKKSKKRRRLLRKIVFVTRSILLFVLLVTVVSLTVSSLLVKMNTSQYSVKSAIRSSSPETFVVGKIKNPSKINLKTSSQHAAVADVLRDNSLIIVTYADIKQAVLKSTYPDFVANVAHDIINYYIYGHAYEGVTGKDISESVLENVSYIKLVTGVELGESACNDIGKYAAKSKAVKELSQENLAAQPAAAYTHITSVMFSTMVLVCLVIALMLLMVLTVIGCRGFAHKMIGWAAIVSGLLTGVAGFLFKPMFKPGSEFVKCVVNAITTTFNQSALIYGAISLLVGVLVILIGKAMNDDEEYDEEDDYIDEIEQVSTAQ